MEKSIEFLEQITRLKEWWILLEDKGTTLMAQSMMLRENKT